MMILERIGITLLIIGLTLVGYAQPAPPGGPPVTITEIMYHPPEAGMNNLEFIEIRNPHPTNQRNVGAYSFVAGVEYTFPPNTILEPHEYIIVAIDSVAFENTFGMPARQWVSGALNNDGEPLILHNPMGAVSDSVVYENVAPWPTAANGSGSSLALCVESQDNSLGENWHSSYDETGIVINGVAIFASPGAGCGFPGGIEPNEQAEIKIYPNPSNGSFSIKSDSRVFDSETILKIHDLNGKLIETKALNFDAEIKFHFAETPPNGTYIISLEGEKVNYRQPLLILE
ncbi:MAG: hypothetical protein ACI9UR_000956 [Bacteroidia bacterium]|jgi:hypothetical protein